MWHAGCSTGEEVYTTAIVLDQVSLLRKVKSTASDLSPLAINKAKRGEYSNVLEKKYRKGLNKFTTKADFENYFRLSDWIWFAGICNSIEKKIR